MTTAYGGQLYENVSDEEFSIQSREKLARAKRGAIVNAIGYEIRNLKILIRNCFFYKIFSKLNSFSVVSGIITIANEIDHVLPSTVMKKCETRLYKLCRIE